MHTRGDVVPQTIVSDAISCSSSCVIQAGGANPTGRDGTGRDGTGRDGTGRDGTGWDGTGRDGTENNIRLKIMELSP